MTGTRVVIGVGNDFRGDDGVGPAVVAALRALPDVPGDVRLVCCDGEPARLIELWDGAALVVVVDAALPDEGAGFEAGDVLRWEPESDDVEVATRSESGGTHALGPGTALRLASILDRVPRRLVAFAVAGADFDPGLGLSPAVRDAVPRLALEIRRELETDRGDDAQSPDRRIDQADR